MEASSSNPGSDPMQLKRPPLQRRAAGTGKETEYTGVFHLSFVHGVESTLPHKRGSFKGGQVQKREPG